MKEIDVKIKLIKGGVKPCYLREGDVCLDCYARLPTPNIILLKGKRTLIPLGFALQLKEGYEAIIRPRSGLSKKGIDVCIGTCDTNYRGELMACVVNNSDEDYTIFDCERICQLAIREVPKVNFTQVEELDDTERGDKGFGSSGRK